MRGESPTSGAPETSNDRSARHRLFGVLLVLLSGMAIAVVPTSAKLAFEAGANTLTVVTLLGVVGMALMALFMAAFGQSFRLPGRTLMPCVIAGFAHALVGLAFVLGGGLDRPNATGVALAALASLAVCVVILLGARAQRHGATSTQVNLIMIAVATVICGAATTVSGAWSLPSGAVGWLGLTGAGGGVTVGLVAFLLRSTSSAPCAQRC